MLLYIVLIGLLILVLMLIGLRWFLRKLRMRHVWAGIKAEREEIKQAFSRLVAQVDLLAQQWQAYWSAVQASTAPSAVAPPPTPQWHADMPQFPDAQWVALTHSGAGKLMRPEDLHEVQELYVDLDKLRPSIAAASTALATAQTNGAGEASAEVLQRARGVHAALRALILDMRQFQALHTDFAESLPDTALPAAV